jgi:crotonobetainyl-CoA:carnitine CoA-transferase CaiB-like acyl-CoA transferase
MSKPLAGIKVVEVAMWAFVPSAGGMLSDLGCEVIKIEPPAGDPIRALTTGNSAPGDHGFVLSYENYNRGKRSITLDLNVEGALDVLHKLLDDADVFLTSLLPPARRKYGIDVDDIKARHPNIIYAVGSGAGAKGPDAEKGGFDAITFWARGSIAASVSPQDSEYPLVQSPNAPDGMPSGP